MEEAAVKERRTSARKRSFLQGRIYYHQRRSSVDCLVRDISKLYGGFFTLDESSLGGVLARLELPAIQ